MKRDPGIFIVLGVSGVGKTTVCREVTRQHASVWHVSFIKAIRKGAATK